VDTVSNVLGQAYITLSDQYGDRRIQILLDSIDTFSNFAISYFNLEKRLQWGATIYDSRSYYILGYDPISFQTTDRRQAYSFTAGQLTAQYPFSTYYRVEGKAGYLNRRYDQPQQNPFTGEITFRTFENNSPYVGFALVGDTTFWARYGPHKGTRFEAGYYYGYDMDDGGTLTQNVEFDARAYVPISQRSELAFRGWLGFADGNQPWIYSFGGLDTLRGYPTRSLSGNRTWFANFEYRFPLIDRLDLWFLRMGGIRGRVFFDVGAAWFENQDGRQFNMFGQNGFTFMEDGVLVDGVSSYGFGIDINLFGLPMHWDWVKIWNFEEELTEFKSYFWVGVRF
jgi:outer membrane protein assembly factor BamA